MHDSLTLQLFSTSPLVVIFRDDLRVEFSIAPWCLLATALTLPEITTRTWIELLEIGFWFLFFYWQLKSVLGDSPGVIEIIIEGREAILYRMSQLLDTLNAFLSLIVLLRDASGPVCLNRLGTVSLEHTFGKASIRYRDVSPISKIMDAFTSDALARAVDSCLDLVTVSHRRVSVRIHYFLCFQIEYSIFDSSPRELLRLCSLTQELKLLVSALDYRKRHHETIYHGPSSIASRCFAQSLPLGF
jgi:hypothetical protein